MLTCIWAGGGTCFPCHMLPTPTSMTLAPHNFFRPSLVVPWGGLGANGLSSRVSPAPGRGPSRPPRRPAPGPATGQPPAAAAPGQLPGLGTASGQRSSGSDEYEGNGTGRSVSGGPDICFEEKSKHFRRSCRRNRGTESLPAAPATPTQKMLRTCGSGRVCLGQLENYELSSGKQARLTVVLSRKAQTQLSIRR
jgi:hypothetical protein